MREHNFILFIYPSDLEVIRDTLTAPMEGLESTFLDRIGLNDLTVRNANLNLRAEPPNPRIQVSPWMNSTIDVDLGRKPLSDDSACNQVPPGQGAPVQQ